MELSTGLAYKGSFDTFPRDEKIADVAIIDGRLYIWRGDEWESIEEIPEKYKSKENITEKLKPRICTNCGAPLKGLKCEYCGTEYEGISDKTEIDRWIDTDGVLHRKAYIENEIDELKQRQNELKFQLAQNQQAAILQQILGYGISYNTVIRAFGDFWGNET